MNENTRYLMEVEKKNLIEIEFHKMSNGMMTIWKRRMNWLNSLHKGPKE